MRQMRTPRWGSCMLLLAALGAVTVHAKRAKEPLYSAEDSVVYNFDADGLDAVYHEATWPIMVNFYLNSCGNCRIAAPDYEEAAKQLNGVVVLAAMDCDKEQNAEACEKWAEGKYPRYFLFPPGVGREPVFYRYGSGTAQIVNFGIGTLDNFVAHVHPTAEDVDAFLNRDKTMPRGLLFTNEEFVDTRFNAVAFQHRLRFVVGQVEGPGQVELSRHGLDQKLPVFVLWKPNEKTPIVKYLTDLDSELGDLAELMTKHALQEVKPEVNPLEFHDTFSQPRKPSKVEHVNASTFSQEVAGFDQHSMVIFYHQWMLPCRRLMTVYEQAAALLNDDPIEVLAVEMDANRDSFKLQDNYGLMNLPSILFFPGDGAPFRRLDLDRELTLQAYWTPEELAQWARDEVVWFKTRFERAEKEAAEKEVRREAERQRRRDLGLPEDFDDDEIPTADGKRKRNVLLNLEDSDQEEQVDYEFKVDTEDGEALLEKSTRPGSKGGHAALDELEKEEL